MDSRLWNPRRSCDVTSEAIAGIVFLAAWVVAAAPDLG